MSSGSSIRYEIGALQVSGADRSVGPAMMEDFLPRLTLCLFVYELSFLPNFMDRSVVLRSTKIFVPIFEVVIWNTIIIVIITKEILRPPG
jgi:hypothetical protein